MHQKENDPMLPSRGKTFSLESVQKSPNRGRIEVTKKMHTIIKLITKITGREIVLKDAK